MSSGGLLAAVAFGFAFAVDTSAAATGAACQLHPNREFSPSPFCFFRRFSLAALGRVKLISKLWFLRFFFGGFSPFHLPIFFWRWVKNFTPATKTFHFQRASERALIRYKKRKASEKNGMAATDKRAS